MKTNPFPTLSLTQLGALFGASSHTAGSWLKAIGLRQPNGNPTQQALDGGYAIKVQPDPEALAFWAWDQTKTVRLLELRGHKRLSESDPEPAMPPVGAQEDKLIGPFAASRTDGDGNTFEIADSNGVVAITAKGEELTDRLLSLLNLCHQKKKWFV